MHSPRPRRIAIADDSPAFVEAAAGYIAALPGYALAGTAAGGEALALIESAAPDVLLLDLGATPVRGLALVRQARSLPGAPAVIAMTLFQTAEAAAVAVEAGAAALIGKDRFVSALTQVLARLFPSEAA